MPLVSNGNVHVLHYNINWIYSAFSSRATAEVLLSPERESGNLTTRDYDAAIQFLPGTHRYYPMIGFASGIAIGFGLRSRYPGLSRLKQLSLFFGTAFTGQIAGKARQLSAHVNYLNDIENPDGYKRAMDNVQKNIPVIDRGVILARRYQISSDDAFPQPTSAHDSSSIERSQSKWDQIRVANSRAAQSSAWDTLRQQQQHEKVHDKPNPQDRNDDKWSSDE